MLRMGSRLLILGVCMTAVQTTSTLHHLLDENNLIRIGTSDSCLAVESLHHEELGQVVKPSSRILVSQCDPNNQFQTWTTTTMSDGVHMTICSLGQQTGNLTNIICLSSRKIVEVEKNGTKKYDGRITLERIRKEDLPRAYDRFLFKFVGQEGRLQVKGIEDAYVTYNYNLRGGLLWVQPIRSEARFGPVVCQDRAEHKPTRPPTLVTELATSNDNYWLFTLETTTDSTSTAMLGYQYQTTHSGTGSYDYDNYDYDDNY